MNIFSRLRLSTLIAVLFLFIVTSLAFTGEIESIHVLKISSQDERAVVKDANGKTRLLKPGDAIGNRGVVTEIAADRVIIEEKKGKDAEKIIIRLVTGQQKIERLSKTGEQSPVLLAPAEKDNTSKKQKNSFK